MIAKQPAIVSPALRNSARDETCTVRLFGCLNTRGVVLAHIRAPGTGIGQKPDDFASCYACGSCHEAIDGKRPWCDPCTLEEAMLHAMIRTHRRMFDRGLLRVGK